MVPDPQRADLSEGEMASQTINYNNVDCAVNEMRVAVEAHTQGSSLLPNGRGGFSDEVHLN